jgi:hypothetical protein
MELEEYDEAGNLLVTYVQSDVKRSATDTNTVRIDVVVSVTVQHHPENPQAHATRFSSRSKANRYGRKG